MIDVDKATELARANLQDQFAATINVAKLDCLPGAIYTLQKFVPDDWLIFAAVDNSEMRVGGSRCAAVHRETGEVLSLGIVGE